MKSTELRQKRAGLIHQARALVEAADTAKRDMLAEENTQYDAIMAEVEKLQDSIDKREKLEGLEADLGSLTSEAELPDGSPSKAASDEAKAKAEMRAFLINGARGPILRNRTAGVLSPELRALQADADASGGYTIAPEQFVASLIMAIDDQTFIRQFSDVQQLTSAQSLGQPYLAADPGDATWTSEILVGSEDSTMTFGKREMTPHPLARYIKVSNKMLRLNPAIEALVIQRLAYKFGIAFEKAGMTGTGSNQPLGVFTASADGISTGRDVSTGNTTTSIQTDGLQEAKYSLKSGYWANAKWIFHRSALKQIAKLQDDDDRYLWQSSLDAGAPDMLLGFPVYMSEYAPSTFTTGLYVGILGDFKYYHIVDSLEFSVQRLVELYAATNQTGFIGRMESDGMPVLEEAFARVKLA
jgi:HK97 family phage major capsid protein